MSGVFLYPKGGECMTQNKPGDLTPKQQRFADEYLVDCNATQAAVRAGYSKEKSGGCSYAYKLLAKPHIRAYIDGELQKLHNKNIADVEEVLAFLTAVMRGDSKEQIVLRNGSEQHLAMIEVSARERLKAAELIGKRYGMFSECASSGAPDEPVIICGGDDVAL